MHMPSFLYSTAQCRPVRSNTGECAQVCGRHTDQGFCQARKQRSGWGMSARWRPHGDVSAAMPSGEPFGLNGYASVDAPSASQYLRAAGGVFTFMSMLKRLSSSAQAAG